MRRRIEVGCLFLLIAASAIPARADLVVSVSSPSVVQGGTGELDVYLTSTAGPDSINNYAFTLQITPNTVGNLAFSNNQNFGYLNDSNYVFFGNSADWIGGMASPPPSGGTPESSANFTPPNMNGYANDAFLGTDGTNDFAPVVLTSANTPVLLAKLTLDASITSAGETFTVSVVPSVGGDWQNGNAPTYFNLIDSNFNQVSFVPYTSEAGTVTIIAASVPEPSSIVCGLSALAILASCRVVQRRVNQKNRRPIAD